MLNYSYVEILHSSHSTGKKHNDKDRCQYRIETKDGETYIAFRERGSILINLPVGTYLQIGWVSDNYTFRGIQRNRKIIQWFKVISTPSQQQYNTKSGTFLTSDIEAECQNIESILGIN